MLAGLQVVLLLPAVPNKVPFFFLFFQYINLFINKLIINN